MQGGAVTLAEKAREACADGWRPDLVLASDMVHLPAVLALSRDWLSDVPVVAYFHENQLTYPLRPTPPGEPDRQRDYTYATVNYLSALAADRVVFNSAFHLEEFFPGAAGPAPAVPRLHPRRPTARPAREGERDAAGARPGRPGRRPPRGPGAPRQRARPAGDPVEPPLGVRQGTPEAFFRVVNRLDDAGERFRLVLAGQTFEEQPPGFEAGFRRYAERVLHYGYAESFADYAALLWRSDVVVSTSVHEFFGLSMMEAIHCGCHPAPARPADLPRAGPRTAAPAAPARAGPVPDRGRPVRDLARGPCAATSPACPATSCARSRPTSRGPSRPPRFDALFEHVAGGR